MPVDPQAQAVRDLNSKLRLESSFRSELRRSHDDIVAQVVRQLAANGTLPDVSGAEALALEPLLRAHYSDVGGVFDHRIADQLPADVAATPEERAAVTAALATLFGARAPQQAGIIAQKTARDAARSVDMANQESARIRDETGLPSSLREEALIAGTIFARSLRGRAEGIVAFETQAVAEAAKLQEAVTLSNPSALSRVTRPFVGAIGDAPPLEAEPLNVEEPAPRPPRPSHQWVTAGDDAVRVKPAGGHRAADSQIVFVGDPFTVGGQRLMYPGDTSLGATADNVVHCRCSAVPVVADIVEIRRGA